GGLSASSAGGLRGQLAAVQTAAANGNRTAALNALSSFSAQVEREAGALSSAERAALRTGIARVRERIMQTVAPATTAASTPTSTSPTPPAVTTSTPPTDAAPPASHHGGPKGAGPSDHPKHDGQHGGHGGGKADGKANGD
ncbi:MAG TPA: hypothetical protein VGI07_12865, partial [Solirubrobacteraceae bacterium]